MERSEQLKQCEKCKNKKFSSNKGIICGLTNEPADFEGVCEKFVGETKNEANPGVKQNVKISEQIAYKVKDSVSKTQITGGYIVLALSILALVVLHNIFFIFLGALYLYMGYWQKDRDVIILFSKYIQIKAAPATATKMIKYEDITKIEDVSKRKVLIHGTIDGKPGKKTLLPVSLISEDDKKDLLDKLNSLIA
jgi:uncharacterized membrane protein